MVGKFVFSQSGWADAGKSQTLGNLVRKLLETEGEECLM